MGHLERENKDGTVPDIKLLLNCFYLGFCLFQMDESNDDIDQMFSNLLGEVDLLTQVKFLFNYCIRKK